MHKKIISRFMKRSMAGALAAVLMLQAVPPVPARAMVKDRAITYEYYTRTLKNQVPASWLFVGTYLMSAKGVTAQTYQLALETRTTYRQPIAYYTSELDQGYWKNVEGAESLGTILPVGGTVKETELYPYLITVVIGDDGIPVDPMSGKPIDVFSVDSPYEMENIPELDGLQDYYESGTIQAGGNKSDDYLFKMLGWFFENDNQSSFDRENLDVGMAYTEYQKLAGNQEQLEELWDSAMVLDPATFPVENKDLMNVLQNWPNIRDKVTDRSDQELEQLNTLLSSLRKQKLSEEADSVLYVSKQVDAARRAEIYYNLLTNTNLTGSMLPDNNETIEELTLQKAEIDARIAELGTEQDKAAAPALALEAEITGLKDDISNKEAEIEEENDKWVALDAYSDMHRLETALAKFKKAFAPVEEEYNRLDKLVDEALAAAVELDDQLKALSDEIDALTAEKKTQSEEVSGRLSELRQTVEDLKARKNTAEGRREEYKAGKKEIKRLEEELENLSIAITKEAEEVNSLLDEAANYTSSRSTNMANSDKEYNASLKQDLDHQAEQHQKLFDALEQSFYATNEKLSSLQETVYSIESDLKLDDAIDAAEKSLAEAESTLPDDLELRLLANDTQIAKKQEELAALSDPYQEKLRNLKAAKEEFEAYEPEYLKKKGEIEAKQGEIASLQDKMDAHDALIQSLNAAIHNDEETIAAKNELLPNLWKPSEAVEAQITNAQAQSDKLASLLEDVRNAVINPYEGKIEAYDSQIASCEEQLAAVNEAIEETGETRRKLLVQNDNLSVKRKDLKAEVDVTLPTEYESERKTICSEEDARIKALEDALASLNEQARELLADQEEAKALIESTIKKAYKDYMDRQNAVFTYTPYIELIPQYKEIEKKAEAYEKRIQYYKDLAAKTAFGKYIGEEGLAADYLYSNPIVQWALDYDEYQRYLDLAEAEERKLERYLGDEGKFIRQKYKTSKEIFEKAVKGFTDYKLLDDYPAYVEKYRVRYEEIASENEAKRKELMSDYSAKSKQLEKEIKQKKDELEAAMKVKASRLKEYDTQYAERYAQKKRELETVEQAIANNNANIKEYNTQVLPQLETNKVDLEMELEKLRTNRGLADESSVSVVDMGDFGVAPTLRFLAKAAKDGNPDLGRKFDSMPDYKANGISRLLNLFGGAADSTFQTRSDLNETIDSAISASETAYEAYTKKAMSRGETAADYTGYVLSRQVARKATDEQAAMPYLQMITDLLNIENTEIIHAERELSLLYGWLLPFSMRDFTVTKTEDAVEDYQYYIRAAADRDTIENAITFVKQRLEYAKSLKKEFAAVNLSDRLEAHIIWLENLLRSLYERQQEDEGDTDDPTETALLKELEDATEDGNLVRKRKIEELLKNLRDKKKAEVEGDGGKNPEPEDFEPTEVPIYDRPQPEEEITELIIGSIEIEDYDPEPDIGRLRAIGGNLGKLAEALEKKGAGPKIMKKVIIPDTEEKEGNDNTGGINLDPVPGRYTPCDENGQNGTPYDGNTGGNGGDPTGNMTGGDSNSTDSNTNGNGSVDGTGNTDGSGDGRDGTGTGDDGNGGAGAGVNGSEGNDSGDGTGTSDDSDDGSGDGDDGLKTANLTREDIEDAIEQVTGRDLGIMDDDERAAVIAAMDEILEEYPNDTVENFQSDLLDDLLREANSFIYRQYTGDGKREYVSLASVDKCRRKTGFRYVHENSEDETTMSQIMGGSASYTFKVGSKDMENNLGKKTKLTRNAVQQTDQYIWGDRSEQYTYIFEEDAQKYLYVTCRYIHGTEWAVLITSGMETRMNQIVDIIEEMIENAVSD